MRHQVVNDLPLGRSVDEALRMVKALQYFEANGEVCPANWKEGARTIKPTPAGQQGVLQAPSTPRVVDPCGCVVRQAAGQSPARGLAC